MPVNLRKFYLKKLEEVKKKENDDIFNNKTNILQIKTDQKSIRPELNPTDKKRTMLIPLILHSAANSN